MVPENCECCAVVPHDPDMVLMRILAELASEGKLSREEFESAMIETDWSVER